MRPLTRALRFVAAQQGLLAVDGRPEVRPLAGFALDVVEPRAPWCGTVVTVHGMSPLGQRDPRMVALHGALASLGFRVVSPALPSIAALRMHVGQIDEIERVIGAVAAEPTLAPSGRVGVLAPSFSAGMALLAAARRSVAHRVSGICAIGPFGDIRETMEALLTRDEMTTFAWKIVLANFLDASIGDCPGVRDALLVAALDEWWAREVPELDAALAALPPADAAIVHGLLGSPAVRLHHYRRILARQPLMLELASVVDHVHALQAPVTLIHGRHDRTIPASQSRTLARALARARRPHRLVVTPLISHGDARFHAAHLVALPALLGAFDGFFGDVAEAPPGRAALARAAALRTA